MSTSFLVGVVMAVLLFLVIIMGLVASGFLVFAIAVSGFLYRVAEDRYPETVGIMGGATGIKNPPGRPSPQSPLADFDHDDDGDGEVDDEEIYKGL